MDPLRFHCVWKIDNFSQAYKNITGYPVIASKEFFPLSQNEYKFNLRLYPNGEKESTKDYVMAFVNLVSSPQNETRVLFRIAVLDKNWNLTNKNGSNQIFSKATSLSYGNDKFILRKDLENLLQNDALLLFWQVEVIVDRYISDAKLDELNTSFQNATTTLGRTWHDYFNAKPNCLTSAYQWRINRFSSRCANNFWSIFSSPYIKDENYFTKYPQYKFHMELYPKGFDADSKNHVSLFLRLDSYPTSEVLVNLKFYITNANGEYCNKHSGQHKFLQQKNNGIGWPKFISHLELFDAKKQYLPNDALTLFVAVQFLLDKSLTETQKENYRQLFDGMEYSSSRVSITK